MCLVIVPSAMGSVCAPRRVSLHFRLRGLYRLACALLIACAWLVNTGYSQQSGGIFSLGISDDAKVRFTWRSNSEPNLAGYKLYVGTVSGVYAGFVDVGRATTFELPDLVRGMTYYFALTAYNTAGVESDCTPELTREIPLLPSPTIEPAQINALDSPEAEFEALLDSPPAISGIQDQSVSKNRPTDPIRNTVTDTETTAAALQHTAYSSNPLVLPSSGLALEGSDANRTLVIDPVNGQTGVSLVTLAVTDGSSTTTMSFLVTVDQAHP